ncbi:thioesterase family protein [Phyllobacterium sp. 0TCS1.6C]|jgi:acyl-CoA thioesterase FadM|uniref:acyl-CoA thioesterase n=1 Tax=unclassified Phyllobacterium TaxID=2638441 RepID=UPI002264FAD7|nr:MULTISPECIES: thioesterase family protein [unclassified Phyllobacterium]MCX8279662.1 thioesterase family protein [Phyllobacterium sp. 0TCS1.6C]MCX8292147.1 thioesterase family protein [Phyllobacterium sp. 0TCS1.6A]
MKFVRDLVWAPTIGLSWLWGLGFFYSFHVTLTYGWLGFFGFAIANVAGLWLFGYILGRSARSPDQIMKTIEGPYAGVFLLFQMAALIVTIFGFVAYLWQPIVGEGAGLGVALLLLFACAVGHALSLGQLKLLHIAYTIIGVAAAIVLLAGLSATSDYPGVPLQSFDARFYGLIMPTLIGFLLGPWLDIQHWQRAAQIKREGGNVGVAYGAGALIFFGFLLLNALTASAIGPIGSVLSIDGLPSAQGAVSAAAVLAAENGQSRLVVAFVIWTVIALASTVDSFYCATAWFLKGKNMRSNSPLLALIPDNIASSPLWLLIGATWVAFVAVPANFSLMYFMMPFATLFVSASANLVCESLGAKPKFDPVLSFMIGCGSSLIFVLGYVQPVPGFLFISPFIGLIGALPVIIELIGPKPRAVPVEIVDQPVRMMTPSPIAAADGLEEISPSHGFDGEWFVMQLIPTYDDTNSVGNVYFANYVRWVGKARELFFNVCMPDFDLATTRFYILTRSFTHDYRRESKEFEQVSVRIKIARHNRKFVTLAHEIHSASQGLLGHGEQSLMFVDRDSYAPLDIPGEVIKGFLAYWPKDSRLSPSYRPQNLEQAKRQI